MKVSAPTDAQSLSELKERLEEALAASGVGEILECRWGDEHLGISAPGAQGSVRIETGELVARFELGVATAWLAPVIERKLQQVLSTFARRKPAGTARRRDD